MTITYSPCPKATISQMIQLTDQQRRQLMQIVDGKGPRNYLAALVILNLAEGRDKAFVAKTCFCSVEEIDRIERAFEQEGVEAVVQFERQPCDVSSPRRKGRTAWDFGNCASSTPTTSGLQLT
jgi:hypothetical protein